MTAKKVATTRIDYPKHWFALGTFAWAVATTLLIYLAWTSIEGSVRLFWIGLTAFEGILLAYLFVLPLFTHHTMGTKGLRLRMGLLINETIPYDWIKEVRETSVRWGGVRVGVGVRYAPIMKVMFVTSSFQSLVALKLDKEHRIGSPIKRPVEEIVISVYSASAFMDQLQKVVGAQKV
jgi:hypothetical protein